MGTFSGGGVRHRKKQGRHKSEALKSDKWTITTLELISLILSFNKIVHICVAKIPLKQETVKRQTFI